MMNSTTTSITRPFVAALTSVALLTSMVSIGAYGTNDPIAPSKVRGLRAITDHQALDNCQADLYGENIQITPPVHVYALLRNYFPDAQIAMGTMHTDPEEGWVKRVVTVVTGIEDQDAEFLLQDQFFAAVDTNDIALTEMAALVISFT